MYNYGIHGLFEGFQKLGYPQIIHFMFGFSMKKTIQLLGYPHDYGNPHFPFPSPSIHT